MPYQRSEHPLWSWSHSRRETFQECPRKYYYQYYASHNGWEADAPETARLAYRLKNLTTLPEEIGAAVHECASMAVHQARSGAPPPTADELYHQARQRLNRAWRDSHNFPAWVQSPKRRRMFQEFYYDTGIGETRIAEAKDQLRTCLQNLLTSAGFREAVAAPYTEVKNVEQFITFTLDDTPIHAVPDLIYRNGNGDWRIVDWKSGNTQRDSQNQAMVYALYLREKHNVNTGDITARIEWLAHGEAQELPITQSALTQFADGIRDSISAMRAYLSDPAANAPLPQPRFPMRDDLSQCRYCKFRQLDRQEIANQTPGPF